MSETKACIACAEQILTAALLCKHCGTRQDSEEFATEDGPSLIAHECNHSQTVQEFASTQATAFWGGPKLKPLLESHGGEKIVAIIPKVKYSVEGAFEEMLIVTESSLLFAGYGSIGGSESHDLAQISALWISDAEIGTGFSDTIALILDFESQANDVELRVIPLGTSAGKVRQTMSDLAPQFEAIAAHIPTGHTGETVVGGYHTNFAFGFFREI